MHVQHVKFMSDTVTVIIPTYNERDNIVPLLSRVHKALQGYSYEILFVDDNSSDGTAQAIIALRETYPIRLIVRNEERGLASAVLAGFKEAKGEIIGSINADLQHPPEVLTWLMKDIENGSDIAIASRYITGGGCEDWSLGRRIVSRVATLLAHLFLPFTRGISDPLSGCYLLRNRIIPYASLKPTDFKLLLEILSKVDTCKITEVPYIFIPREKGESKLALGNYILYMAHLLKLMWERGELLRFVKFCLVGGSGILINMCLLWVLTELAGLFYLVSSAIAIETAIISNYIFNSYFTFSDRRPENRRVFFVRLLKFNSVSLVGLGINIGVLWFLTEVVGAYYLLSNLAGILAATLWRYIMSISWTWR